MKTMCMFCGKSHKTKTPEKCIFKGAMLSALLNVMHPKERWFAVWLGDKTPMLENAWNSFSKERVRKGK